MSKDDSLKIEIAEIAQMMKVDSFRNIMYRLINNTNCERNIYCNDSRDHAYQAGKRAIGLYIKDILMTSDIGNYNRMIKDNERV